MCRREGTSPVFRSPLGRDTKCRSRPRFATAREVGVGDEAHRDRAGVPTVAVGLITDPHLAHEIVATGQADAVMAGREFLRDPHFALRAAHELGEDVPWPFQYSRGTFSARPE